MTIRWYGVLVLALALPLTAGNAAAQGMDSTYAGFTAVSLPADGAIRSGAEAARADEQAAGREIDRLTDSRARLDARLNVQKADIDAIRSRADLAKKDKRDADRADLDFQRRRAEADRKTLEEIRSLFDDQIAEMSAKREWARARSRTADAELALFRKRQERASRATADSTTLGKLDTEVRELESRVLDARKDESAKQADWASRYRDTVSQEMSVWRAQQAARAVVRS